MEVSEETWKWALQKNEEVGELMTRLVQAIYDSGQDDLRVGLAAAARLLGFCVGAAAISDAAMAALLSAQVQAELATGITIAKAEGKQMTRNRRRREKRAAVKEAERIAKGVGL